MAAHNPYRHIVCTLARTQRSQGSPMPAFVEEKIRDTHAHHGASPGGVDKDHAEDPFEWPPDPKTPAAATADAEIADMARKFEETVGELASPRDASSRASQPDDEFSFELSDDDAEAARLARFAKPRPAHVARREPMLAQLSLRREPAATPRSDTSSTPRAPDPAPIRSKPATMIFVIVMALAVGAAAGFIAANAMRASDPSVRIGIPAGSGAAGLRLDYQLKQPPASGKRGKP